MEIEEIIKAVEGKDIGSDVIAAIKGLDQSGEVERLKKELGDEQGKSKGILADKKRYKEERDAHKAAIDKIENDKLPTEEQHAKAMQELQDKLTQSETDRKADADKTALATREAKLAKLTGSVKWANGVPQESASLIVKSAMANIDDLGDESKVGEALKTLTESHKSLIEAKAPAGSGGNPGGGGGGGGEETHTLGSAVESAWNK